MGIFLKIIVLLIGFAVSFTLPPRSIWVGLLVTLGAMTIVHFTFAPDAESKKAESGSPKPVGLAAGYCGNCGAPLVAGTNFCGQCGSRCR
jgi:hypothetical protein